MANKNKSECSCMGFYDEAAMMCIPHDPATDPMEPCPKNPFWGNVGKWLEGTTQEQWVGGATFGVQMCQIFGGCQNLGGWAGNDPNSAQYQEYLRQERRKTNAMILVGVLIAASLFYLAYKKKK